MAVPLKPSTKLGWWAFWLGVGTAVWGTVGMIVPRLLGPLIGPLIRGMQVSPAMLTVGLAVVLAVCAIAVGIAALVKRDRSWMGIAGLALAAVVGGFWILFAGGEVLFPH